MRSMRKTEPFGSKQLCVGKNSFELCNTDRLHHRVLSARADNQTKKRENTKNYPAHTGDFKKCAHRPSATRKSQSNATTIAMAMMAGTSLCGASCSTIAVGYGFAGRQKS